MYATIAAVETFVDRRYQQPIDRLADRPEHAALRLLLECQADECERCDEALSHRARPPGSVLRAWCALVGYGSSTAVHIARRL